jgi:tetratricopeptide (TPR) repeat protein
MNTLLLLAALAALAICAVGVTVLVRRYRETLEERKREAAERAAAASRTTIIDAETRELNGATVASVAQPRPWYRRAAERSGWGGGLLVALAVLLTLVGLLVFSTLNARTPERYVVLVAPFDDGGDGQTGRNVAASLARELEGLGGEISVAVASRPPADARDALELAAAESGDLLIWGSVEPGAMLDSPSLTPSLIYIPSGRYAPNGWDGYLGRFAMPRSYTLAREPINGRAVLVPLVGALYSYASGAPDGAFETLGQLLENYPALNAPLPRALRGNVLWARTFYEDAAAEYRLALAEPSAEQALLANNLGAILLDAGDSQALAAFQEAVRLLEGRDLGELRFNLATLALREDRPLDAVVELEQARNLLPPHAPLLLALAGAYREAGRLDDAAAALTAAGREAPAAIRSANTAYRPMMSQRYDAAQREEQALLDLARQLGAQGELLWELEVAPTQTASSMSDLRRRLDAAADRSAVEVAGWRRRAASDSAAGVGGGLVATGQAERAEVNADRQRFYLAVVETELARVQRSRPRSIFGALFGAGQGRPSQFVALEELQRRYPNNPRIVIALGRAHRLISELDRADQLYDLGISLAPQAPEGYFGKGAVARARGDRQRASELYAQALERSGAFFPARFELAAMAEEQADWAAAIVQLRALYQQRSGDSSAVALAQALRLSGPSGYVEAEQVLMPLSASNVNAAIELARLYNDAGRPDAATGAYLDALRLEPDSSAAAFELGETYQAQGDLAAAERYYGEAVRADPANVEARLALADLYQGPLAQPQRADREYSAALAQGVDDPEALAKIGAAAMGTGNYAQAVNAYSEAAQIEPENPLYRHRLGQAYFAAGRMQQAAEEENLVLTLTAARADPEALTLRAEALVTLGDVARLSGDLPGATSSYNQALQLSPNLITAEIGLGLVAVGQGNWGVASGYFQSAAAMPGGADDPMAQFWLGEAQLRQGSYAGATAAYNRALELRPQFPEAYLGLAQVQYALSGPRDALATVSRAVEQKADYAEALLFQGKMLQELGDRDGALAAYNNSIRANRRIAESYYRRGMVLLQINQYDEATSDFRQATGLQPNFPEAFYWLGRSYYAEGRLEPALQAFQQAVALNGNYLEAIFYVGLASEDLGRIPEALSAYQTVIAIDGGGELAERARASIARLS